jgi:hypothetical protein
VNRSGLTFSAAAAMLLSLPALAAALPAAASPLPAAAAARAASAHAPMAPSPGAAERITLSANLVIDVRGAQSRMTLTGAGTMTIGSPLTIAGRIAVPFLINCGPLTGNSPTLGRVQATMQGPQDAWLIGNSSTNPLPAQELLPLNDHITIGALAGQTLIARDTNSGPAILRSSSITSIPPQNTVYQLASPTQLVNANYPSQALATIKTLQVTVQPAYAQPMRPAR